MSQDGLMIKSGIWYTISNFLLRAIGIITTPIFTRLMTQEEFGAFNNYSSWLSILMIIVTLNIEATLISARFEFEKRLKQYVFSILTLSTLSALIWMLIINMNMDFFSDFFSLSPVYINSMLIYLLLYPAVNLFQTQERYFYRYKMSVFLTVLVAVGSSFLSVVFVICMENRLAGRILGYILPTIIIGLVIYILLAYRGKTIKFSDWKYALKICIPFIPHLLSLTILSSTDRIMITKMCGETDTALYSLAYNVAMLITMLLSAFNGAITPWLGERLAKKEYSDIRQKIKIYIVLFAYMSIGIMLLAPEVLLVLGGNKYLEAKSVMIPVALGCMCQFLYTLFVNVEQFCKKTVGMAFASASAAVLNYVLNLWLIPKFGYVAAAYTTLIGYIWLLLVHMILVRVMKMNQVYSYRFVLGILALMCIVSIGIGYLYNHMIVRYTVICIYAAVLICLGWKNRNQILKIIKK